MNISLPYDFTPRYYQERLMAYLDNGGKRAAGVWHRRAGKDVTMLNQTAKMAHMRVGAYWHCLPTYKQAKKAIWDGFTKDGKKILPSVFPPAIVKRKNDSEMLIELKNGSIVQLIGSDTIDNLVGAGPVGVTFSEFSISKPNSWDLVRPMLQENGGWAAFIFTPRGNNHAKRLFEIAQKTKGWYNELLTIHDTDAFPDPDGILREERNAGMPEPLIRQEYLCDFTAALVGAVWGDLLELLEKRGGMQDFDADTNQVFCSFDLGIGDATSIWFWTVRDDGIDFIDYFEASGKPMSFYLDELERRPYRYAKVLLPHDARARTLQTGNSIQDMVTERYPGKTEITPGLSLADGIQAGRWVLQQNVRFHPRCAEGLDALKQYHYEYDEERRVFGGKPEHDWSSHSADAFRYASIVAKAAGRIYKKPAPPIRRQVTGPASHAFSLDKLFEDHERDARRKERV